MTWQDVIVFLIVGGAVAFLVRRVWPRRSGPAETFVPMDSIKRRSDHDDGSCH